MAPYVEYHGFAYLKNAVDSHSTGLKIQLRLKEEDDLDVFKKITKRRKGKAGVIYRIHYREVGTEDFRVGDVWFLGVSWSHTNGCTVAFEISEKETWEWFRDRPATDGKSDSPLEIEFLLFRVNDDGELMNIRQRDMVERAETLKGKKGGPQSIRAARLCNHTDFINWLIKTERMAPGDYTPAQIADWMRKELDIVSRVELDHDEQARSRFEEMHSEFIRWLA